MTVVIDKSALQLADVVRVARGEEVALGDAARRRIAESRAVVDRHVEGPDLIYGLNTGLGHMRDERVPVEALRDYQPAIVMMHAGGIGEPLPREVVRAAMVVRVAGIACGGAGASPAVADMLVELLNRGVTPIVPRTGSVGASDLMHMAAIAQVVIGRGSAEFNGELLPGDEALRRADLAPIELQPKDGLALVSANGVAIGHAALIAARTEIAVRLADLALALSLEVSRGNLSILDPLVARAKPIAGQAESAARITAYLRDSQRCVAGSAVSVQDPLSFRVGPQVHGALLETNAHLVAQVDTELASMDDNPLVDIEGDRLISNGNFHPLALALAADALRPALAHVGQLSDRRLNHLWAAIATTIDPADVDLFARADEFAGLLMRYSSAVRYTELRELAAPVTLDLPPLDLAVEDHATNAPLAVARSEQALDLLDDLLTVELLVAADGLRLGGTSTDGLGRGTSAAVGALDRLREEIGRSAPPHELHAGVRARVYDSVLEAAESVAPVGPPSTIER
jgi:histidine ammonia-lyase